MALGVTPAVDSAEKGIYKLLGSHTDATGDYSRGSHIELTTEQANAKIFTNKLEKISVVKKPKVAKKKGKTTTKKGK